MSSPRRQRQRAQHGRKKYVLWLLVSLPLLLLVGYFIAKSWLEGYLRGGEFRRFVSHRTAETLRADGEFAPLHFAGMNVHSDGFRARGSDTAAFSSLAVEQIRAELSLRRWSERVWQIEEVDVQRIAVELDGSRITLDEAPALPVLKSTPTPGGTWLPNRVEIGSATVHDLNVGWGNGRGALRGVGLAVKQKEGAWEITGNRGHIDQAGLPSLDVGTLRMLYRAPSLFVQSAEFRQGATGVLSTEGEVRFGESVDLRSKLSGIELAPFLNSDWRLRLHGQVSGDVRIQSDLPTSAPPKVTGSLRITQGQLEALPVLDQIAAFTLLDQYRKLALTRCTADFEQSGGVLRVTNLAAESEGLIRIEGGFTIANEMIDGTFQVGVTSTSLQWLPGSQTRVFTENRGGYVWAPMRLVGPVNRPTEDLSPRLVAAAKGAVIEKVESTAQEAVKTGREVIKGAFDFFLPPPK